MNDLKITTIDTPSQVRELLGLLTIRDKPNNQQSLPILYLDLEGVNLCREGTISIITLLVAQPAKKSYLIDVHTLGALAFSTPGSVGKTFKDILQDKTFTKVFFDVRNDSDALFAHFGVALKGVEDVQLMINSNRKTTEGRRRLRSLDYCIRTYVAMPLIAEQIWGEAKYDGKQLFAPENGGSYQVFNQRPMSRTMQAYCVGDVQYLPELRRIFSERCRTELVAEETEKRVVESQSSNYQPNGPHKALAHWSEEQNRVLDEEGASAMLLPETP
ncbi:hypothetical protein M011DRAFT_493481 [Sporormia fimetaria CBS 119925]|uniref:3'-5' exonuclease domain-containing protein n=1 Tax=Sporormia fimetaria CBS 119925 TaxID=1340428 RepID=A0A6A6VHE8_9PLEO|nr:hypothetical protein M011DRAFT_493481 [Sporormia fimetaria CBS 119925]